MSVKYLGAGAGISNTLIYKDKVYYPGDDVPMAKNEIARLVEAGHRFEGEGNDAALREGMVGHLEQHISEMGPFDDRGQMMPVRETRGGTTVIANDASVKAKDA